MNIANGMSEKGYNICFVTNFSDDYEYKLNKNIKRISLEKREFKGNIVLKNIGRIKRLRTLIKREKPTVSIAFMRENNFRLILAARYLPTKTIVSVRNDPAREYSRKSDRYLANYLFSQADGIVFQTKDARMFFSKNIQEKSEIIFNQVDKKFFNQNGSSGEYIIACGRLSNQKNYPMMLKAFVKVLEKHPNEHLMIYGKGDLKDKLEALADRLKITESVHFMGFSDEMVEVYKKAKLLVMTSDYEGMPNVILEALASSVPVISTDCPCGGPRMVIMNGENGYLVPIKETDELVKVWEKMLDNGKLLAEMRKNAYKSSQQFTSENIIDNWIKYINKVITEGDIFNNCAFN